MELKNENVFTLFIKKYFMFFIYSTDIYLFLYLWWFLINLIQVFFGKMKFFDLFTFIPFATKRLILFTLLYYSLGMSIASFISDLTWKKLSQGKYGLTRRHPFTYYFFEKLFILTGLFLPIHFFTIKTGELNKTRIAILIYLVLSIVNLIIDIYKMKKGIKQGFSEDRVCAYISLTEWNDRYSTNREFFHSFRFCKPYFYLGTDIYKTDNGIICPYWLYLNYLKDDKGKKNVKFILISDPNSISSITSRQMRQIYRIIDECLQRKEPVLVVHRKNILDDTENKLYTKKINKQSRFLQEILKRPVQFLCGSTIKEEEVKDFILQDNEKSNLVDYISKLRGYLDAYANTDKYSYVKEELTKINLASDEVATFYRLVKIVEYIFHYRAIALLAMGKGNSKHIDKRKFTSSMGSWKAIQNISNKVYKDDEVVQAYRLIDGILNQSLGGKRVVKYHEISDLLTQLRNRYIGHGTMAFSVSTKLLISLMILVLVVLQEFLEDGLEISDNDVIKLDALEGEEVYCMIKDPNPMEEDPYVGLLSGFTKEERVIMEFLDYKKGEILSNTELIYDLSYHI